MAATSSSFSGLVYEALTGNQKNELKEEKRNALLEQESNIQNYKKKLASYRSKMAAQGISGISTGIQNGLKEETDDANTSIIQKLNQKIKNQQNRTRKKTLLSLGFNVGTS
ncbi:MAG: hypothetical protein J6Y03_05005 [Alphaproteobacteria bacterium]|nr:hypothetical protein [Alphaproteobacteria bacterium]